VQTLEKPKETAQETTQSAALTCRVFQPGKTPLRRLLRETTRNSHERLHRHPGFAAILDQTIDRTAYKALLSRLWGFYISFETAAWITPQRSRWLKTDLLALGVAGRMIATIPRCPFIPQLETPERRAGALYVVEGSALGGRELARRLDRLLGSDATEGRSFLTGRGSDTGAVWRTLVVQLESWADDDIARGEVSAAAVETFVAFEEWLADWGGSADVRG
jgi:heme oxygenase